MTPTAAAAAGDILTHLVQLNTQRAAEEAQGRVHWLRPAFHNSQNSLQKQELLPQEHQAPEADFDSENSLTKQEQIKPAQHPCPHPARHRSPLQGPWSLEEKPAHPLADPGSPGPGAGSGHGWRSGVARVMQVGALAPCSH